MSLAEGQEGVEPQGTTLKLTLPLLVELTPIYKAGLEAKQELSEAGKLGVRKRKALETAVRDGERARDTILEAAMPLIKSLASSEFRRRARWGSRIDLQDLIQEGCLGFLRGLSSYDPTASSVSPSHYLGQWVVTEIRRSSERADNDMTIPTAKSQQWRRIRAIRARLRRELGREPTDKEIIEASGEVYSRIGPKLGSAQGDNDTTAGGTPLSQSALDAERDYRLIASSAVRIHAESDEESDINGDWALVSTDQDEHGAISSGRILLGDIMCSAMELAGMPALQQEIIGRFHGIHPFEQAASISDACAPLGVSPRLGQKVVDAYTELMAKPGGPLHRIVGALSVEAREVAGLSWVADVLGDMPDDIVIEIDQILVRQLPQRGGDLPSPSKAGAWGLYQCDVHAQPFMMRFPPRSDVSSHWPCPSCGKPSALCAERLISDGDGSEAEGRDVA